MGSQREFVTLFDMPKVIAPCYRNGFPFLIRSRDQDFLPFSLWDGATFGPSGRPSRRSDADVDVYGPGTLNPIGMSLSQLSKLYWRAKEITHSMNVSMTFVYPSSGGVSSGTKSVVASALPPRPSVYSSASEAWLVSGWGWGSSYDHSDPPYPAWTGLYRGAVAAQEGFFVLSFGSTISDRRVIYADGLYWPGVRVLYRCGREGVHMVEITSFATNPVVETAATLSLMGLPAVPMYGYQLAWPIGAGVLAATGSITLEPTLFWDYDGEISSTTGEPI